MEISKKEDVDERKTPYKELKYGKVSVRRYPKNTYICKEGELICIITNKAFINSPLKWLLPVDYIEDKKELERELNYLTKE